MRHSETENDYTGYAKIDFEVWKSITALRKTEAMTENAVIKELLVTHKVMTDESSLIELGQSMFQRLADSFKEHLAGNASEFLSQYSKEELGKFIAILETIAKANPKDANIFRFTSPVRPAGEQTK